MGSYKQSLSCAVQIHYNVDGGSVIMFVECIERCRVGPDPWTNRKYVVIGWCVLEFEVVIGV